jgi:hypothetical protein
MHPWLFALALNAAVLAQSAGAISGIVRAGRSISSAQEMTDGLPSTRPRRVLSPSW